MPIKDQKKLTDFYYKVNDSEYKKLCIEDFNASLHEWEEQVSGYIRSLIKFTIGQNSDLVAYIPRLNLFSILQISGALDWIIEYCPNRRVAYLIKYGKNDNVRHKNIRRAIKLIMKEVTK